MVICFCRRMSSSLVTTVSTIDELQNSLKNDQNTVVAYIEAQDSIGMCNVLTRNFVEFYNVLQKPVAVM